MDSVAADRVAAGRLWQGLSEPSHAIRAADRYFALMGRPMMQVRRANGEAVLLALDPATGAFLPSYALQNRFRDGLLDAQPLDHAAFHALVRRWRARALAECEASPILWTRTTDADFPYAATRAGQKLALRCGGHLAEPSWTLFAAGEEVGELTAWPAAWNCEEPRVSGARAAWAASRLAAG
ncbi:hypothetical protein [Roseococcus suduntuyensis]|uniref:Uncharacterized protein n=1 Tax=Roseococcus suduntuyensis TaxID=455361 RepID=A0A840AB19_9PROT|nr:hypothetical protein [Roseococcus suduntuyensis]MBB3897464.1 hypothetical protein [Roseococcus suduntuyensis]